MRKIGISIAIAAAATADAAVAQQSTSTPIAGNISLVSEYRFRGIDQTFGKPAIQGGFDYTHASGIYLGNWNSNVNQGAGYPGGNIEMDLYGGYKRAFGDLGFDVGFIYYAYPGTDAGTTGVLVRNNRTGSVHTGAVNNKEIYFGGSWKFLSAKYFHSLDDYFSTPGTRNTGYVDLAANYDVGNGWGLVAHYGHLDFRGVNDGSYSDWKVGATKDLSGWIFGASYVATNAKGSCPSDPYCYSNTNGTQTRDAGRSTVVLSVSKTF